MRERHLSFRYFLRTLMFWAHIALLIIFLAVFFYPSEFLHHIVRLAENRP
jgi:hypothetical protein